MIFTYLKREENSLSSEVLPAAQLKANVVVLVNVLQLKLGNTEHIILSLRYLISVTRRYGSQHSLCYHYASTNE